MGVRARRRLARTASALAVGLAGGALALHVLDGGSMNPYWVPQVVNGVLFGCLGAYIAVRRPGERLGWILVAAGLGYSVTAFSAQYALPVDAPAYQRPLSSVIVWLGSWTWAVSLGLTTNVALLVFPDGRLPSRRWWPAALLSATGTTMMVTALAVGAWGVGPEKPEPDGELLARYLPIGSRLVVVGSVVAALSLVVRYARASGRERGQVRAVTIAGIGLATGTALSWTTTSVEPVDQLAGPLAVGAIAFALIRHRLYGIDVVLNRMLVYAGLSLGVAATYGGTVAVLGMVGARSELVPPVVASVAVALVFAPLRDHLQGAVNRLFYGDRRDPLAAIERLGQRLEEALAPDAALEAVVAAVAEALRVPAVALQMRSGEGFTELASVGESQSRSSPGEIVSLVYRGEFIGRLLIWPRPSSQALPRPDRRLVEGLAHQIAAMAHAARLAGELQRSRERLVSAREEERRRIRRDLHDGLGSRLSGVVLGLQASRNLLARDTERVGHLLEDLCTETQEAIADVRRLVYQLRPPVLDELGLVAAIRQHAASVDGTRSGNGEALSVEVKAPEDLGALPAAVEVAVYWLAAEAITNVVRHAGASRCCVVLSGDASVKLEVVDDGRGLGRAWQSGVGFSSMRERVAELGGSLSIGPGESGCGTRVVAELPIAAAVAV
jgi:two-component system NarL family sensor kinase